MDGSKFSNSTINFGGSLKGNIIGRYALPRQYYATNEYYEFVLVEVGGKVFLSDQGRTAKMLDAVFELRAQDVLKNLMFILKKYEKVQKDRNGIEFFIEVTPWDGNKELWENATLETAFLILFACVSFMEDMRIFYI
jgi:hypothetical protein